MSLSFPDPAQRYACDNGPILNWTPTFAIVPLCVPANKPHIRWSRPPRRGEEGSVEPGYPHGFLCLSQWPLKDWKLEALGSDAYNLQ